jgi:hypothetical protein
MFFKSRAAAFFIAIVAAIALSPQVFPARPLPPDIRIDVPAAARVHIENPFGGIAASVWQEKYVSVAASIEGGAAAFRRSPIVIDNRNQQLQIAVVRTPLDPAVGISLTVKFPEDVQVEINTSSGAINIEAATLALICLIHSTLTSQRDQ